MILGRELKIGIDSASSRNGFGVESESAESNRSPIGIESESNWNHIGIASESNRNRIEVDRNQIIRIELESNHSGRSPPVAAATHT